MTENQPQTPLVETCELNAVIKHEFLREHCIH